MSIETNNIYYERALKLIAKAHTLEDKGTLIVRELDEVEREILKDLAKVNKLKYVVTDKGYFLIDVDLSQKFWNGVIALPVVQ